MIAASTDKDDTIGVECIGGNYKCRCRIDVMSYSCPDNTVARMMTWTRPKSYNAGS